MSCLPYSYHISYLPCNVTKQILLIVLLLFSGSVQHNPGPELQCIQSTFNFKSLSGVKVVHLNMGSLLSKMDIVRIWVNSTDVDIVVISETRLTKTVANENINISGYNVLTVLTDSKKDGFA